MLLILAVALSTGALLASWSISATAARQVDADLAASTLRELTVTGSGGDSGERLFPSDAADRAEALDGVEAAGLRLNVSDFTSVRVSRGGVALRVDPDDDQEPPVVGVSEGYLRASGTSLTAATAWLLGTEHRVVLLGTAAAQQLDIPITSVPTGLTVLLDDVPYSIAGFLDGGTSGLGEAVVVPYPLATEFTGSDTEATMLVRTAPGAGPAIASVIRLAVRPEAPERLVSSQVVDVAMLRTGVSTQLGRFAAWAGGLLLVLTTLLIANAMIVSVTSRKAEIGLRRAMGATRRSVAGLFLMEAAICAGIGGVAGGALATVATVVVSALNDWTASVGIVTTVAGPVIGALAGIVSSVYPAMRAARTEPAQAVRSA
ncbi:ABC transporter permease [Xylanimonas sp. McL0601]|uniref:ABC transporter permease n=1 Tax=Xylanimonas sp. McL0601 TaxID=3414739 RepID=UPI003CEE611E